MPTYEYACRACGERIDRVQAFTDDPLTVCPNCGGELRKLFGSVGIVFKGSGFYKTDSRSATSSTTPPGDSGPSTSDSSKEAAGPKADSPTTNGATEPPKPAAEKPSTAPTPSAAAT